MPVKNILFVSLETVTFDNFCSTAARRESNVWIVLFNKLLVSFSSLILLRRIELLSADPSPINDLQEQTPLISTLNSEELLFSIKNATWLQFCAFYYKLKVL